jgi:hypothetical protein
VLALQLILHTGSRINFNFLRDCEIPSSLISQLKWHLNRINKAASLSIYIKEVWCAVNKFLWAESVPGTEIHLRLPAQYGNSALCIQMDNENGRTGVTDEKQAGRPSTSTTEENSEQVHAMILDNLW